MGLIDNRNGDLGVIEGRFIKHVLDDQADEILKSSQRGMKGSKSAKWGKNKMTVDGNSLTYDTIAATRFVDMKTRKSKGYTRGSNKVPGGKKRKKHYIVHNKPIMRHKKFIVRTLSFGFTDEIKENFRQLAKDDGLIN